MQERRINAAMCQLFFILAISGILFYWGSPLLAQTSTGEIDVTVLDPSGALIGGAHVTISGTETGDIERRLDTDLSGLAVVPLLNPGNHDIKVEKEGFKTLLQKGLPLHVTEVVALRLTLELGATAQSVTIVGQAPLVDTTTNAEGQVVGNTTMEQLPLNGRNYLQLALLTAGTVPSANKDTSFSAFGNRGMQNEYLLDGGINESLIRGLDNHQRDAMRPSLDAVAEFKVETSNYSAEYGSSAGGVVNVVTKSGTNEIHGSAFEFIRNKTIAARDFFAPAGAAPPLVYNQFGGSLGGPIKKNRAWVFGAYQQTEVSQGTAQISTVPTAAEKAGNFTAISNALYDPNTTVVNPSGSGYVRSQFTNYNIIPSTEINTIGAQVAGFYPNPNLSGLGNNYNTLAHLSEGLKVATFRGDVQVSSKDSMFGRYSFNKAPILVQASLPPPAQGPVLQHAPAKNVGYGYTHVFGPTLVNELRFSYSYIQVQKDETIPLNDIVPNSLFPGNSSTLAVDSGTPTFTPSGYAVIGTQPTGYTNDPLNKTSALWEISDNMTKNMGRHLLKLGYTHQFERMFTFTTLNGRGAFTFDGSYTQNPQSRSGTGNGVADLLLGLAEAATNGTTGTSNLRAQNDYAYFQDEWKATQRLTLNLGIRYELYWPFTDTENKLGNLVLNPASPSYGKMIFATLGGQSRSMMNVAADNFAPRFGFAYRIPNTSDLTVRGGFGIFFGNPDEQIGVGAMMTNVPPFVGLGGNSIVSDKTTVATAFNLSGSFPAFPAPVNPANFVLSPTSTTQLQSWPTRYTAPRVLQWNMSIEKQLPGNMLFEISYVGNRSYDGWNDFTGNQPLVPGPGGVNARRPTAAFTIAPTLVTLPWMTSYYEGLAMRLEKRMSHGLYFLASLNYGRAMDLSSGAALDGCSYCGVSEDVQNVYDLYAQLGPSDSNLPRRVSLSGVWDSPFGPGKRYAPSGWASQILRDWQTSGIYTIQDGPPFTLDLSFDNANVGAADNWPNRICNGRISDWTVHQYFNQSCFPTAPAYTFGNAGRNILNGPGMNNMDFTLHRFFTIPGREGMKLEFRAEFFNFFNHPEFSIPAVTTGVSSTATITSSSYPAREDQFALKLLW